VLVRAGQPRRRECRGRSPNVAQVSRACPCACCWRSAGDGWGCRRALIPCTFAASTARARSRGGAAVANPTQCLAPNPASLDPAVGRARRLEFFAYTCHLAATGSLRPARALPAAAVGGLSWVAAAASGQPKRRALPHSASVGGLSSAAWERSGISSPTPDGVVVKLG